jgi:hypothetical protein
MDLAIMGTVTVAVGGAAGKNFGAFAAFPYRHWTWRVRPVQRAAGARAQPFMFDKQGRLHAAFAQQFSQFQQSPQHPQP